MTTQGITKAFALLASVYGARFQVPQDAKQARFKADIWADLLDDISDEAGLAAFRAYCRSQGEWPPSPAHIRELVDVRASLPSPGEAWAEVWQAASHHGYCDGRVPEMSCPEIREAARATPWFRICLSNTQAELSFAQRDFVMVYEGLCKRTERELDRVAIAGHVPDELMPAMKRVDDAIKGIEP